MTYSNSSHVILDCEYFVDGPNSVECGTPYFKPDLLRLRIVGGYRAKNFTWPWIVQLRLNEKHECGGAIIAPNWIITAKHCFLLYVHLIIRFTFTTYWNIV